jgi:NitT/TauT family transport system substrate-binding protein
MRAAGGAFAFTAGAGLLAACGDDDDGGGGAKAAGDKATVRWVSPRASLDVMDDYNLWVPIKMGYFDELGITAKLNAGPGANELQLVAENQLDMAFPSPGVLTSAIGAGVPMFSIWEQYPAQVFNFAVPEDSDIRTIQDLAGKSISVLTVGFKPVIDTLLAQAGVDYKSVKLVENGNQWIQAATQGQTDAAFGWEGLRAQLLGQGVKLHWIVGSDFSEGPSNVYAVRKADLEDDGTRDAYARFLQGVVMGLEFAKANPRAAAQITYEARPVVKKTMEPQVALDSMVQLAVGYGQQARAGNGWGYHDLEVWDEYLATIFELEQVKEKLTTEDVLTNEFVDKANADADLERVRADAEAFELDSAFAATTVPDGAEL